MCTHLHPDHVGWNTQLENGQWVPTFPNAKYIFHKAEYAAWEAEHAKGANPPGTVFRDNCLPIVEAGQALLVDDDFQLDDLVTLTPTPGHSPHHCCVNLHSAGDTCIVTGDLMHHAIQCREPSWWAAPDWDSAQGIASRRNFLGQVAGSLHAVETAAIVVNAAHVAVPTGGLGNSALLTAASYDAYATLAGAGTEKGHRRFQTRMRKLQKRTR